MMTKKQIRRPKTRRQPPGKLPALYAGAAKALAQITDIDTAKKLRDEAVAFQTYYEQANDGEMVANAAEVRFRAETRCGEILRQMEAEGKRASRADNLKRGSRTDRTVSSGKPQLDDLGVTERQSSRWQKMAKLKEAAPALWQQQLDHVRLVAAAVTEGDRATLAAVNADRHANAKIKRDVNEQLLASQIRALSDKKNGVVLGDPAWRFKTWSAKGLTKSADNHYATSELAEIMALDIDRIAADDCALFLWATVPMLDQALTLMTTWQLPHRSHCIWKKNRIGTGYIFRNCHELLLYGTRGNVPAPAPGTQWPSVIEADVGAHSAKPEIFYEMIEAYFPNVPKIELYARGAPRPGWSAWGAETINTDDDEKETA